VPLLVRKKLLAELPVVLLLVLLQLVLPLRRRLLLQYLQLPVTTTQLRLLKLQRVLSIHVLLRPVVLTLFQIKYLNPLKWLTLFERVNIDFKKAGGCQPFFCSPGSSE
jgi:hypothetical protein